MLKAAQTFAADFSRRWTPSLFGVTDGKAVGTFVEQQFRQALLDGGFEISGNSALGIDLPELNADIKVTSVKQPQSSSPYRSARQKVYGLGYSLLLFVYDKMDDPQRKAARLDFKHCVFIEEGVTGDYQTTFGLLKILANNGNQEEVASFLMERNLPLDELGLEALSGEIMAQPPPLGYLTLSNALQWRLQYARVLIEAGKVEGVLRIV